MPAADELHFAFGSGALTYDCGSCGKCCRGYGLGEDISRLATDSRATPLLAFADIDSHRPAPSSDSRAGLLALFTFADGCRYQGDDHLCDIHRQHGAAAKPRICRLFPFSQIVDIDGLWTVIPQPRCPWRASRHDDDESARSISDHGALRQDFGGDFLEGVSPERWQAASPMAPEQRRALESRVQEVVRGGRLPRFARRADETPVVEAPADVFRVVEDVVEAAGFTPWSIQDEDLWLDLLRCAGAPRPLDQASANLLVASVPILRALWSREFTQEQLPLALRALHVYLMALDELGGEELRGEDLLHLADFALPWVRLMVAAERPLPDLPESAPHPDWNEHWPQLRDHAANGSLLGPALLEVLRPVEHGAVVLLRALGRWLGGERASG